MTDVKVSALTAATTAADTDLVYVVTGAAGSPASKKMTVADFKTLMFTFVSIPQTSATLASDAFTPTSSFVRVDTQDGAATDNCTTINSGSLTVGTILILRANNASHDVTFVDGSPLRLNGNCTFGGTNDTLTLVLIGTDVWAEVARSING